MAFHIVLFQPEIPANTGNIVRTCSVTGAHLHLIHPLGFSVEDKYLKRAGLDYWDEVAIHHHRNYSEFLQAKGPGRLFFIETSGTRFYHQTTFQDGDYFVFGKETTGIPKEILEENADQVIRIPMSKGKRSLNLSNTAAIVLYEGLRQIGFSELL
ncbi:tRNA (uridine(34)/cytosine(34)/5-carboxymethylaminomethyluridine(34)-2'-O)-methyltransferase TrmL [Ammoniphilus resinae]|uniref:Putative tRNA (cytidine(34)-2'-O)-methyltransferase n=1 Tax=Ammoniphilus resinae TaxID=861532 RepID=A0ABS4GJ29_9BACL|nr:tRNA (uridine(34)/cytosine(34)/5-carboxymethylaminomethyluridine(34)-2'-O)-methyltransferase TrmL [Ammoniphilus resinae]MBP1930268.1 tRNA (cytidine/uridine-2'-O-)-methyltransferase [Ammoniphilus resinae]